MMTPTRVNYELPANINEITKSSDINPNRFIGKVAVITASTDGIGFAIAERLAQEGAKVVISSRKEENVKAAVEKLKQYNVHGVVCHVGVAAQRKQLFIEAARVFGGVDIFVSNAALNPQHGPVLETDEHAWDKMFDINVKSSFLLSKEVLPYLQKRGGGSIIYVSSIAGLRPYAAIGAYCVTKSALISLTKAAADSYATQNIRINCVAPGMILTKFSNSLRENRDSIDLYLSAIAMRRFGVTREVSGVVAFLASNDASYITGETIPISGGVVQGFDLVL